MQAAATEPMGKDVFLRLLTTQLRHQDPLEPMDGTQFVTQLAQFTQLEQTTSMNARLKELVQGNTELNNYGVTGLIGKEVKVMGEASVDHIEGGSSELSYQLDGEAEDVILQVKDESGSVVRTLLAGAQGQGFQRVNWDGRDQDGRALPSGAYQFDISATDRLGGPVSSSQFSEGLVSSVLYEEGLPYLMVNGGKVPATDVVSVRNYNEQAGE